MTHHLVANLAITVGLLAVAWAFLCGSDDDNHWRNP